MGKMKYSDSNEKGKSGFYETFDSGDGPTVPDECKGEFAHNDSGSALSEQGGEDLAVPTVPSKK